MVVADLLDYGWCRDLPDHRDMTPQHSIARRLLASLQPGLDNQPRPLRVDWREYFLPVQDQLDLPTSSAHACIALVQYFQRRSTGEVLLPSRLFVHANSRRLAGRNGAGCAGSLRTTLKAVAKFGLPPERHWPYDPAPARRAPRRSKRSSRSWPRGSPACWASACPVRSPTTQRSRFPPDSTRSE